MREKKSTPKLPSFRPDLVLRQGSMAHDGGPTYTLFDPLSAEFYHLSWSESEIYRRLTVEKPLAQLMHELSRTTLNLSEEDVLDFLSDSKKNKLLMTPLKSETLIKEEQAAKQSSWQWFLYHYLYFRVPLINPDQFLSETIHIARLFCSKTAFAIYSIAFLASLYIVFTRFNEYISTFYYFFNLNGLVIYSLSIILVKCIHEFAHAYVAKAFHVRVPAMGFAVIVLWPVLYTDVTDSWKLASRLKRFLIAFAGVSSELVLAAFATIGWAYTEPGILNSVFFVVSSSTWITSVFMNINPAMRFDGYYMFSDLLGIENLQTRAFEMTRWKIRRWLWGMELPPPEVGLPLSVENTLVVYSLFTWVYRLFLYTSIAILVYLKFTKFIGIILFLVEIIFFLIYPIIWEFNNIIKLRRFMVKKNLMITGTCMALLLLWIVPPWPHSERIPGITVPIKEQIVYVPYKSRISQIFVKRGDKVAIGDPLFKFESDELKRQLEEAKAQKAIEEKKEEFILSTGDRISDLADVKAKIQYYNKILVLLTEKMNHNLVNAQISGTVYEFNQEAHEDQFYAVGYKVATISDLNQLKVVAYLPEKFHSFLQKGQDVVFILNSDQRERFSGMVLSPEPTAAEFLIHPQLASINKGPLPVFHEKKTNQLTLASPYFTVDIALKDEHPDLRIGQTGEVAFEGPWRSLLVEWIRSALQIFWRESGF